MQLLDVFDPATRQPLWDAGLVTFSTMCWPNPNEAEKRAALLAYLRFDARQRGLTNHVAVEDHFALAEAHRRGWNIKRDAGKREALGWRAGDAAFRLVCLIANDEARASVIDACRLSASKPVGHKDSALRRNANRLKDRAWDEMLPAVPLWAAAYFAKHEDWLSHHWMSDHGALMRMLRHAQMYRDRFEGFIQRSGRNAGKPILPPGVAWQPPLYFLDPLHVYVPQLTDHERAAIACQRQLTDQRAVARQHRLTNRRSA